MVGESRSYRVRTRGNFGQERRIQRLSSPNQKQLRTGEENGIKNIITPYWLAEHKMWKKVNPERWQMPVMAAMDSVAEIMSGWTWGPAGSAGFEMATGYPALKTTSDLDLVIDAPKPMNFLQGKLLLHELDSLAIRVDIQVETNHGAFLLREWIGQRAKTFILRTQFGPLLVRDPWSSTNSIEEEFN